MGLREQQARMLEEQRLAQQQADAVRGGTVSTNHSQHILEIALKNEVDKIRAIPSFESRNAYKREHFLPKWLPFVEDYFKKGATYQNDIIGYCLIYLFDVGHYSQALVLAERAIANNQALPARFERTIPVFCADQIYQWAERTFAVGGSVEPYFSQVLEKITTSWHLNEIVTAKWLKMTATLLLRTREGKAHPASYYDPERLIWAILLCKKAFTLNHKAGVKSLVERCEMRLAKLAEQGINIHPQAVGLSGQFAKMNIKRIIELLNTTPLSLDEVIKKYKADNV